jgi:hypothetical protein
VFKMSVFTVYEASLAGLGLSEKEQYYKDPLSPILVSVVPVVSDWLI